MNKYFVNKKKLNRNKPIFFYHKRGIKMAQKWICTLCGYIYDPAEGDPDGGIAPGTAFEDIPEDWVCPECGAAKEDFEPYED